MNRRLTQAFATLGLRGSEPPDAIRARFRQLARQHHPDRARTNGRPTRFQAVVDAYRLLEDELGLRSGNVTTRRCERCDQPAELFEGADGTFACVPCLFGETDRRRILPLQPVMTLRHLGAVGLYAVSAGLLLSYLWQPDARLILGAFMAALGGLVLLAASTLRVRLTR
jgi:hypothetical protein